MKRGLLAALALLASCEGKPRASQAPVTAAPAGELSSVAARDAAPAPTAPSAPNEAAQTTAASPVPDGALQLVLAVVDGWDAVDAELSLWSRDKAGAPWQRAGEPWVGVIGSGAAWGIGLHGEGPPVGRQGPRKREGDGRSPAGVFALGPSWGYTAATAAGSRWPYTRSDAKRVCVDDGASASYGRIVDGAAVTKDWSSSEVMKRKDDLYAWVVEVDHNPSHVPGQGSCIFLHVWRKASAPTVGCTAMPRQAIERLLAFLSPEAKPVFVLLPKAEAAALASSWKLPPP